MTEEESAEQTPARDADLAVCHGKQDKIGELLRAKEAHSLNENLACVTHSEMPLQTSQANLRMLAKESLGDFLYNSHCQGHKASLVVRINKR